MKRRVFLKRGLIGGAVLAVGGTGLAAWPTSLKFKPTRATTVLDERRFAIFAAIAARVVTVSGADPVAIAHTVDDALARAAPEAQKDIRDALMLFDNALAGALLDFRFGPFTSLDPAGQDAVLASWRDSRLMVRRGAYKALKNLCVTSFYRKEHAWAAAGYPGPPDADLLRKSLESMQPPAPADVPAEVKP